MEIRTTDRGILQIDGARIVYRNFSGLPSQYNREGDRNFALVIPTQEMADDLLSDGWNVKIRPPREDGDDPFIFLPIKIKFNDRGPKVYLKTGARMNELDEESVDCLDDIDISNVDLDIRPFDWDVNGATGRTAYLQLIEITQNLDRFAARHREEEPEEAF